MIALLLLATLSASDPAYVPASDAAPCDRYIARGKAKIPNFTTTPYFLSDAGTIDFRYRFYARAGELRVSAMVAESERRAGVVEVKAVWEDGDEVFIFMDGAAAQMEKLPVCVRKARPGFDLDNLYASLKPRLKT